MKLKNGWRRWTSPTTIKRDMGYVPLPVRGGAQPQPLPQEDYEQPEFDLIKHEEGNKIRRTKIRRQQKMGDAKEIVGTDKVSSKKKTTRPIDPNKKTSSVTRRLVTMIDDLDRAIEVKQNDLDTEGDAARAENNYKLGILKAADSLIRRAQAMLEDYGADLTIPRKKKVN